uniref:Uncharacterized protein n=1 Tax=Hyaloperonospora arabidopsidis (strain Emoy2) TaxID=559515 RepID=M4BHS9_HYAAE
MPPFLRAVLDCKKHLRLYGTVQVQVEGQLVLHLGRNRGIPISSRQPGRSRKRFSNLMNWLRLSTMIVRRSLSTSSFIGQPQCVSRT